MTTRKYLKKNINEKIIKEKLTKEIKEGVLICTQQVVTIYKKIK